MAKGNVSIAVKDINDVLLFTIDFDAEKSSPYIFKKGGKIYFKISGPDNIFYQEVPSFVDFDQPTNDDYKKIVELYQRGAIIEYHQFTATSAKERCHVGFRYDAMSDDDYFELVELEEKLGVEEQSNWRGDVEKRSIP